MTGRYDGSKGAATHLLQHYFRLTTQCAGVQWDSDNDVEIEAIVDGIITAAVHQVTGTVLKSAMCPACGLRVAGASGLCPECEREAVRLSHAAQASTQEAQPARPKHDPDSYSAPLPDEYRQTATQEDGARGRRPDVSVEAMDADTVGVLLWDKAAKQDYAYVSFCAASTMITVYAAAGLSVNIERYEDYFRRPATDDTRPALAGTQEDARIDAVPDAIDAAPKFMQDAYEYMQRARYALWTADTDSGIAQIKDALDSGMSDLEKYAAALQAQRKVPVSAIAYLMADIAPVDAQDVARQHEARATVTAWLESLEAE